MMAIGEMAKQTTTLPVFVEQAAELLIRGHKSLSKDSIVVTCLNQEIQKKLLK